MKAAELYQKTLAGYEALLSKGESMSLSRYCKLHHVNNRGLRYWMKKNSIISPNAPDEVSRSCYPIAGQKNKPLNRAGKKPEIRSMGIAETLSLGQLLLFGRSSA